MPNKQGVLTKSTGRVLQMAQKATPKKAVAEDPHYTQAVQSYESGLRAMQERKFDKAKGFFQKVFPAARRANLADRASVHLNACNQHLEKPATQFKTPEEHYDYAVSLINLGDYVSAREHLDKLSKQIAQGRLCLLRHGRTDCLTGHVEDALRNLDEAIRINPGAALPGAQRFRLPASGGRSALHRTALSRSRR